MLLSPDIGGAIWGISAEMKRRTRVEERMELETDVEDELDERPAADRPTERPCICCGKIFPSAGWSNRLCGDCKWRDGRPYF